MVPFYGAVPLSPFYCVFDLRGIIELSKGRLPNVSIKAQEEFTGISAFSLW